MTANARPLHNAPASSGAAVRKRPSPNRQRLMARIGLWTVVFPTVGFVILPRLLF